MPDVDIFELPARQWKSILDCYVEEQDSASAQLADDILAKVIGMLKHCGGCILLPQLAGLLWRYKKQMSQQAPWDDPFQIASFPIEQELNALIQQTVHRRIEMIAIRATHTTAIALQAGVLDTGTYQVLQEKLAEQIVEDLIRHSGLDSARARSIGTRFANGDDAYQFYTDIMTTLRPGVSYIARQLVLCPDGETLAIPSSGPLR